MYCELEKKCRVAPCKMDIMKVVQQHCPSVAKGLTDYDLACWLTFDPEAGKCVENDSRMSAVATWKGSKNAEVAA